MATVSDALDTLAGTFVWNVPATLEPHHYQLVLVDVATPAIKLRTLLVSLSSLWFLSHPRTHVVSVCACPWCILTCDHARWC